MEYDRSEENAISIDSDYYYTASELDESIPSTDSSDGETTRGPDRPKAIILIQAQLTEMPERARTPMCVVCGVRPRYKSGIKSYPTCGLSCAGKLERGGDGRGDGGGPNLEGGNSDNLCVVCHKRPKYSKGGKSYPQCGRTCRDKARAAQSRPRDINGGGSGGNGSLAISGNNKSCLMCWKAPARETSHFCGSNCANAADHRAPLLLEAPRGHFVFQQVANYFKNSWGDAGTPAPDVKKVYKIVQAPTYSAMHKNYRSRVGNELRRWHGAVRACTIGNGGNTTPCTLRGCSLCHILRSTFNAAKYPDGMIHTSSTTNKSDNYSKNLNQYPSKAMFLTKLAAGKSAKLPRSQLPAQRIPAGHDSVQLIGSRSNSLIDDLAVDNGEAVQPSYLVIYG
ncbi:hypothetical protein BOTBODRAFT_34750 [Botryobasidium botryosum FD-172 SS1]|uniref:Uncharacterized protein n=1 Tax=Botryobasidium botryosum (strain FD-172 SS1) TaxID=930990 RepID=A0A067MJS2_BOTB1|nr:hypothetical protein BOTBODRAFT_34750 [Botryobasidium botryosum FD-172 SS1]